MSLFDKITSTISSNPITQANPANIELQPEWTKDRIITINTPMPESVSELQTAVDISDPGSVAAYWVYSVMCLTADYDIGMSMMKYLFADIEPFGRGFTEGGAAGKAGWDTYFNERIKDDEYRWLPRAYFKGSVADNGFNPPLPLTVELHYNTPKTETINKQSVESLGRLNIVYWVKSNAAGNQVNITVSRFDGSNRWYVTSGASSSGLFYDQRAGLTAEARSKLYSK